MTVSVEYPQNDFDLAVPFNDASGMIRVSLLAVSELEESHVNEQQAWMLDGGSSPIRRVVMLINDNTEYSDSMDKFLSAITKLQMIQVTQQTTVPCITASSHEHILQCLKTYVDHFDPSLRRSHHHQVDPIQVVGCAVTTTPPQYLSIEGLEVVVQLCSTVRALEEMVRTKEGQQRLLDHLDERIVRKMIEFWQDEWIA